MRAGRGGQVFVEVKVVGAPAHTVEREVAVEGAATLRALLSALVHHEVTAYQQRRDEQRLLHVLTGQEIAAGERAGRVISGGRTVPATPPLVAAVDRALESFGDGLFYVFLDGQQLEDLDAPIAIGPASRLRLVRLVALAGG